MGHARFYDGRRAEGVEFAKLLFFVVNIWTHLPYRVTKLFSENTFQVYICGKSRVSSSLEERWLIPLPGFLHPFFPSPLSSRVRVQTRNLFYSFPYPPQVCNSSSEPQQPIKACSPILGEQRHRSTFWHARGFPYPAKPGERHSRIEAHLEKKRQR